MRSLFHNHRGQALLELTLGFGLLAILVYATVAGFVRVREADTTTNNSQEAYNLLNSEVEHLRVIRENRWTDLTAGGPYHTTASSSSWILTDGVGTSDIYNISTTISNAFRDSNGDIAAQGAADTSTKQVVINISWDTPVAKTLSQTLYLTKHLKIPTWVEGTLAQFDDGEATPNGRYRSSTDNGGDGYITIQVPPGQGQASYTYTSSLYDCNISNQGAPPEFTKILWEVSQESNTEVKFQVGSSSSSSANFSFRGPDGATNTYYTTSNTSLYIADPTHCYYKYQMVMTSNLTGVPVLEKVTLKAIP